MSAITAASGGADRIADTYSDVTSGQNVSKVPESSVDDGSEIKTASVKTLGSPEAPVNEGVVTSSGTSATKKKKKFFSKVGDAFRSIGSGIKNAAQAVGKGIVKAGKTIGNGVKNAAQAVGKGIVKAGKTIGNGVKNAAQAVGKGIVKAGKTIGNGVKNAAKTVGKGISNAVKQTYSFVSKTAKKILPYVGPALTAYLGVTTGGAFSKLLGRMFGGMSGNSGTDYGGAGFIPGVPSPTGGGMFDPTSGYNNYQQMNSWSPTSMMNYRYYVSLLNSMSNSIATSIANSFNTLNAITSYLGSGNLGSLFRFGQSSFEQSSRVKSSALSEDGIEEIGEEDEDSLMVKGDSKSVPVHSGSGSAQSRNA